MSDANVRVDNSRDYSCSECSQRGPVYKFDNGEGAWATYCLACLKSAVEALAPMSPSFVPSTRQIELMEHAVGGDSRHRNHFDARDGTDDMGDWAWLMTAGLATASHHPGGSVFSVTDAGFMLIDARARPRILEARARAWNRVVAAWGEVESENQREEFLEWFGDFIQEVTAPDAKGPRALAGAVVDYLVEQAYMRTAEQPTREIVVEHVAEIIRKALGGAS